MPRTLNTIASGFLGGIKTSSARKKYAHQVLNIEDLPTEAKE